jgi:GT2 family glycosyltransferase
MSPLVSVTIVTWNSARFVRRCLETIRRQDHPHLEIIVVDNDSRDGTRAILRRSDAPTTVLFNAVNRGFAAGQNQAIAAASGEVVLVLNPDTLLPPAFVGNGLAGFNLAAAVGMVAPKLLRTTDAFELPRPGQARIDSSGIYLTASLRHFDRGAGEPDHGQYEEREHVFGPSGAAAFYRRQLVEQVKVGGEFFDEMFFAYREDADVAWRARLAGWECLYWPAAVAYHFRHARPELGRRLSPEINRHSVKNRFLMRIKNTTPELYARVLVPATLRDLVVLAGVVLVERQSIPGIVQVLRHLPRVWRARREIQARRRPGLVPLEQWVRVRSVALRAWGDDATAPRHLLPRSGDPRSDGGPGGAAVPVPVPDRRAAGSRARTGQ